MMIPGIRLFELSFLGGLTLLQGVALSLADRATKISSIKQEQ